MKKVKIKRVPRKSKPVTKQEKIMAGFGVGGALIGGLGGVKTTSTPAPPNITSSREQTQSGPGSTIKEKLVDLFGIPKAKADDGDDGGDDGFDENPSASQPGSTQGGNGGGEIISDTAADDSEITAGDNTGTENNPETAPAPETTPIEATAPTVPSEPSPSTPAATAPAEVPVVTSQLPDQLPTSVTPEVPTEPSQLPDQLPAVPVVPVNIAFGSTDSSQTTPTPAESPSAPSVATPVYGNVVGANYNRNTGVLSGPAVSFGVVGTISSGSSGSTGTSAAAQNSNTTDSDSADTTSTFTSNPGADQNIIQSTNDFGETTDENGVPTFSDPAITVSTPAAPATVSSTTAPDGATVYFNSTTGEYNSSPDGYSGTIYQNTNQGWQKFDSGTWTAVSTPPITPAASSNLSDYPITVTATAPVAPTVPSQLPTAITASNFDSSQEGDDTMAAGSVNIVTPSQITASANTPQINLSTVNSGNGWTLYQFNYNGSTYQTGVDSDGNVLFTVQMGANGAGEPVTLPTNVTNLIASQAASSDPNSGNAPNLSGQDINTQFSGELPTATATVAANANAPITAQATPPIPSGYTMISGTSGLFVNAQGQTGYFDAQSRFIPSAGASTAGNIVANSFTEQGLPVDSSTQAPAATQTNLIAATPTVSASNDQTSSTATPAPVYAAPQSQNITSDTATLPQVTLPTFYSPNDLTVAPAASAATANTPQTAATSQYQNMITGANPSQFTVTNIINGGDGSWTKVAVVNGVDVNVQSVTQDGNTSVSAWDDSGNSVNLTAAQVSQISNATKESSNDNVFMNTLQAYQNNVTALQNTGLTVTNNGDGTVTISANGQTVAQTTLQQFASQVISVDKSGITLGNLVITAKNLASMTNPLTAAITLGTNALSNGQNNASAPQSAILYNNNTGYSVIISGGNITFVDSDGNAQTFTQAQLAAQIQQYNQNPAANTNTAALLNWLNPGTGGGSSLLNKLQNIGSTLAPALISPANNAGANIIMNWAQNAGNAAANGAYVAVTLSAGTQTSLQSWGGGVYTDSNGEIYMQTGKVANTDVIDTGYTVNELTATSNNFANFVVAVGNSSQGVTQTGAAQTPTNIPSPLQAQSVSSPAAQSDAAIVPGSLPASVNDNGQSVNLQWYGNNVALGSNGQYYVNYIGTPTSANNFQVATDLDPNTQPSAEDTTNGQVNYYFVDSQGNQVTDPATIGLVASAQFQNPALQTAANGDLDQVLADNQVHPNFTINSGMATTPTYAGNAAAVGTLLQSLSSQLGDPPAALGGQTESLAVMQNWADSVNQNGITVGGQAFYNFMTEPQQVGDQTIQLATVDASGQVSLNTDLLKNSLIIGSPSSLPHEASHAADLTVASDGSLNTQVGNNTYAVSPLGIITPTGEGQQAASPNDITAIANAIAANPDAVSNPTSVLAGITLNYGIDTSQQQTLATMNQMSQLVQSSTSDTSQPSTDTSGTATITGPYSYPNWQQQLNNYSNREPLAQTFLLAQLITNPETYSQGATNSISNVTETGAYGSQPELQPVISALNQAYQSESLPDAVSKVLVPMMQTYYSNPNISAQTNGDGSVTLKIPSTTSNDQWAVVTLQENSQPQVTQYQMVSPANGVSYLLENSDTGSSSVTQVTVPGLVINEENDMSLSLTVPNIGQMNFRDGQIFGADNQTPIQWPDNFANMQDLLAQATSMTFSQVTNGQTQTITINSQNKTWSYQMNGTTFVAGPGIYDVPGLGSDGGTVHIMTHLGNNSTMYTQSVQNGTTTLTQQDDTGNPTQTTITLAPDGSITLSDGLGNSISVGANGTIQKTGLIVNPNLIVPGLQSLQKSLAPTSSQNGSNTIAS